MVKIKLEKFNKSSAIVKQRGNTPQEKVFRDEVNDLAIKMLRRIFSDFKMEKMESLMVIMQKLFRSSYKKIIVNENQIAKLRQLFSSRKGPVIFVPTHRSYIDFLVLSTILYYYGLEVPLICSGEDFLSMAFVSDMLRCSGAFFMRRTFRGDELYKAIFYEYVRMLNKDR